MKKIPKSKRVVKAAKAWQDLGRVVRSQRSRSVKRAETSPDPTKFKVVGVPAPSQSDRINEFLDGLDLNYNVGSAVDRLLRGSLKGSTEDLMEARRHLDREIVRRETIRREQQQS